MARLAAARRAACQVVACRRLARGAAMLALALGLALGAKPALAHTELQRAEPAPGSTVPPGLAAIVLEFNEPLAPGSTVTLYGAAFSVVAGVETRVEGAVLTAALREALPAGTYTVEWTAVGLDGHPVQGSYQFAVSGPNQASRPAAVVPWLVAAGGALLIGFAAALSWRRSSSAR